MLYNRLGKSGLHVSKVCLGTMAFGGLCDEKESFYLMDMALDNGINFFDSANGYGMLRPKGERTETRGHRGYSEEIVGKWFAQGGGRREKVVMCTKFNAPDGELAGANNVGGLSAWKIRRSLDDSLARLQTDHVEIYMMHRPDRKTTWSELWNAFTVAQYQGKIDYVASSAHAAHEIVEAGYEAKMRGLFGLIADEHRYNLVCRIPELEVIPALEKMGMAMLPYSPLGGGHLAGFALDNPGPRTSGRKLDDYQVKQLQDFKALSQEIGISEAQIAMAWLLKQPIVGSFLTGPRTPEMLQAAIDCVEVLDKLNDEVMARLDEIFPGPGQQSYFFPGPGKTAADAYNW